MAQHGTVDFPLVPMSQFPIAFHTGSDLPLFDPLVIKKWTDSPS